LKEETGKNEFAANRLDLTDFKELEFGMILGNP
jgi:hypothetical protein